MGTFRDVIPELSVEECRQIALEQGGAFGGYGFGYDCPKGNPTMNDEFGCKVVNRQGMGNHGFFVLIGRTPQARELLRKGKANQLMEQFQVPNWFAVQAVGASYAFEITGLAWGIYSLLLEMQARAFAEQLEMANSHRRLRNLLGDVYGEGFSFPRHQAAIKLAVGAWHLTR